MVGWCTSLINLNTFGVKVIAKKIGTCRPAWLCIRTKTWFDLNCWCAGQRDVHPGLAEGAKAGGEGSMWRQGSFEIMTITVDGEDNINCNKYSTLRSVMWSWEVLWWSWLGPTDHHSWQTFFATNSPCYEVSWAKYVIKLSESVFISIIPSWKSKSDANMFCPLYWSPPLWRQPCCWNIMSGWHLQSVA